MVQHTVVGILVTLLGVTSAAQSTSPTLTDARLARYLGEWSYDGTDNTPVTGGPVRCVSTRRPIATGAFVESHRTCRTPRGDIDQVEVFGYDSQRREYVYWGFNGGVVSTYATPTPDGDTVVWTGFGASAGNRCMDVFASDLRSFIAKCETSRDGGATWILRSGGTTTRIDR